MKKEELRHTNQVLLLVALTITALYVGADFLIPLSFAVLFSTLVLPVARFLEQKLHFGRGWSSMASTFLIFVVTGLLLTLFARQGLVFVSDVVAQRDSIGNFLTEMQSGLTERTGYSLEEQIDFLDRFLTGAVSLVQKSLSVILTNTTGAVAKFLLMLIYVFLLLLYRNRFVRFVGMYTTDERFEEVREIISQTSRVAHHYLWGRIQVMLILAAMYIVLFLSYGLEHTWLLVVFGALITVIPYFGPFVSGVLPVIFMVIFGHSFEAVLSFTILITIIQLIESYVLEPLILGYEVQQNPLFVIIAVILGGAVWGLPGLILFVPLFSILKIIFDHSPALRPVGYLMGFDSKKGGNKAGFIRNMVQRFKN